MGIRVALTDPIGCISTLLFLDRYLTWVQLWHSECSDFTQLTETNDRPGYSISGERARRCPSRPGSVRGNPPVPGDPSRAAERERLVPFRSPSTPRHRPFVRGDRDQ